MSYKRLNLKVCAWCEQSPKQFPCKTTRKLNHLLSRDELEVQNDKGEYLVHLNECTMLVSDNCTNDTKLKYNKLKI